MKVILIQDVAGLGKRLDVKNVSDGHALNMLIPRGLVREATTNALKQTEKEKTQIEAERKIQEELLLKNLSSLEGKTIHISAKANEKGHLFAAIHENDIVTQLKDELRVEARSEYIKLSEHIKTIGEHKIAVSVGDKKGRFTLIVEATK